MPASVYTRPKLYPKQLSAIFCPERWSFIEASTKSGKTVGCMAWLVEKAFEGKPGQNFWWVAPVFSQADIAYQRIKNGLTRGSFTPHGGPQPHISLISGSTIWIKSGDNPDSLYGEDVHAVIVDEASRTKPEVYHAVRSTLTATRGPGRFIGNVKGRKNWFFDLARRAEKGDLPNAHFAKITCEDAVEAGVLRQEEIDDARTTLPESVFRELYMAEAADDGGNPFGLHHIAACAFPISNLNPVAWGVDLAKKQDWTVLIGFDEFGHVCQFHRWQFVPWRETIHRIHQIIGDDTPALVDSTGIGDPVLEELQVEHGNFVGYNFSMNSKQKLMEGLAVSIQGREITFPSGVIQQELESFEYEYTRTGVRYTAPEGYNDDCVCALALARQMWVEKEPSANVVQFYAEQAKSKRQKELDLNAVDKIDGYLPPGANRRLKQNQTPTQTPSYDLDNELTALYNSTFAQHVVNHLFCYHCGELVHGPHRVSDGENIWHPQCTTLVA
jgi:hypothetical protein